MAHDIFAGTRRRKLRMCELCESVQHDAICARCMARRNRPSLLRRAWNAAWGLIAAWWKT